MWWLSRDPQELILSFLVLWLGLSRFSLDCEKRVEKALQMDNLVMASKT